MVCLQTLETVSSCGASSKHLFERVALEMTPNSKIGLKYMFIEGMFGTEIRTRPSRPSAGYDISPTSGHTACTLHDFSH